MKNLSVCGWLGCVALWAACGAQREGTTAWAASALSASSWIERTPSNPPPARFGSPMVYDSIRGKTVLFSGALPDPACRDTWEFDGVTQTWTNPASTGPSCRSGHGLVFDSVRGVAVLFGGFTFNGFANDVWEWNGAAWNQRTTTTPPSIRGAVTMAFDPDHNVTILFGGQGDPSYSALGDTWEYDGTTNPATWTLRVPQGQGPQVRWSGVSTYDTARHRMTLFGGVVSDTVVLADTHFYDAGTHAWTLTGIAGPPPRAYAAFAYDTTRRRTVIHGGAFGDNFNDTWEFDGASWMNVNETLPGNRYLNRHAMAYDASRTRMVMFGGIDPLLMPQQSINNLYEYLTPGGPCDASCASGFCVDGVCCAEAQCSTCHTCSGSNPGYCTPVLNNQDADSCSGAGQLCGPGGLCGNVNGLACTSSTQCASGFCANGFCCNTACNGSCQACDGATRGWPGATNGACANAPVGATTLACAPRVCGGGSSCPVVCVGDSDCQSGYYCAANGQCAPQKPIAATCDDSADCRVAGCGVCESGFCADGVCCASECGAACAACNLPGTVGACTPVAPGALDPRGQCTIDPQSSCGLDGTCDGAGACRLWPAGTQCAATTCASATTQNNARVCDGAGACSAASASSCGRYQCVGAACRTTCSLTATDCAGANTCVVSACVGGAGCATTCAVDANCCQGQHCVAGACVIGAAQGQSCDSATDCASGNCVDGYCCDSPCASGCGVCHGATLGIVGATNGVCTMAPADYVSSACSGARCNGTSSACPAFCSDDAECADDYYCNGSNCELRAVLGTSCATNNQCTSGHCVDGVCCDAACDGACNACNLPSSIGQCAHDGSNLCGGCAVACTVQGDCCPGDRCVANLCRTGTAPTITSMPSAEAYVDEPYRYAVMASGGAPITYRIVPVGAGASVEAQTGRLTFSPTNVGTTTLTVFADNPWGSTSQLVSVDVAAPRGPQILENANPQALVGTQYVYNAALAVQASGAQSSMIFTKLAGPVDMTIAATGEVTWLPTIAGPALVTVSATNLYGSDEYSFTIDVAGATTEPPPVARAGVSDNLTRGDAPFVAQLDASASTGLIERWEWNAGDGTPPGTEKIWPHVYGAPGGYVARLRVIDPLGRADSDSIGIQVGDGSGAYPPVVKIELDAEAGPASLAVNFRCDCTLAPSARLLWLFGDGAESTDPYPSHVYARAGTYEVSLYGFDPATGLTGFDRVRVSASDGDKLPPLSRAYANPSSGNLSADRAQILVNFVAEASDSDGTIASYRWTLDGAVLSTASSFTHAFTTAGTYSMALEVTDSDGLLATSQVEVQILRDGASVPKFLSQARTTARASDPYRYSDDDSPSLRGTRPMTFALTDSPDGMRIDSLSGRITWTPSDDQVGDHEIRITAQNTAGLAEQRFVVAVEASASPGSGCSIATGSNTPSASAFLSALFLALLLRAAAQRTRSRVLDARMRGIE